jgi:omega-6 fatty acid desaturase (delta-12 desaturase)
MESTVVSGASDPLRTWRATLDPYTLPRLDRSLIDLGTSVVPYLLLVVSIYFALAFSVALALVLAVPAAAFLIRTFIVFHDCAHGSFLRSRRGNETLGVLLGLLLWLPFSQWRHEHAVHHATAGDLDRRGVGDIQTLTVAEYRSLPLWRRLAYRLFRNPVVMFGLGWMVVLVLKPRFAFSARRRIRNSVLATNVALAVIVSSLVLSIGWRDYLLVQGPVFFLAGAVGVWLFYVQHQFEDTYWQHNEFWRYDDAALRGSSYLKLPKVLQFFTGNIGLHHVHHLSARIPNYNLQAAHDDTSQLQLVPHLSLRDALRATRLKLWDEQQRRLVTFREARG